MINDLSSFDYSDALTVHGVLHQIQQLKGLYSLREIAQAEVYVCIQTLAERGVFDIPVSVTEGVKVEITDNDLMDYTPSRPGNINGLFSPWTASVASELISNLVNKQ